MDAGKVLDAILLLATRDKGRFERVELATDMELLNESELIRPLK